MSPLEALGDPLSSMALARTIVDVAPAAPVVRARVATNTSSGSRISGGLVGDIPAIIPADGRRSFRAEISEFAHGPGLAKELGVGLEHKDGTGPGTPPTGAGNKPANGTAISGPGSMPIRPGSVVIIADTAPSGDPAAMRYDAPSGTPIVTGITGWSGVIGAIQDMPDGSITDLNISGHGNGYGGVDSSTSWENGGGLDGRDLTGGQGDFIRKKLAPGGRVVFYGCGSGGSKLVGLTADKVGVPAVANTGLVTSGDYGEGDWIRFDPTPPTTPPPGN